MPRTAINTDVYTAIAEPRRRQILELVGRSEQAVNDVVTELGMDQPSVSKHLRVLREVNLVRVRRDGRRRLYSVNPQALKPVHDWVQRFEGLWSQQLDAIQARAEAKQRQRESSRTDNSG
jgi:DNA-binding transcriptional ArsR family regulator